MADAVPDASTELVEQPAEQEWTGPYLQETPQLDLEAYIANYSGITRFERLLHIGRTSSVLSLEALRAAVKEAKSTANVAAYKQAWSHLRKIVPQDALAQRDDDWINSTAKSQAATLRKLEKELASYRNAMVKESIWFGLEDLSTFQEFTQAPSITHNSYVRLRAEARTVGQTADASIKILRVLLNTRQHAAARTALMRMSTSATAEENLYFGGLMTNIRGVSLLGLGRFDEAAMAFANAAPADFGKHSDIMSANDVAVYGGLLALATMDRITLRLKALNSASFRFYLSFEPYMRKAVSLFVHCRYAACLDALRPYWTDYKLDVHLYPHVERIRALIEKKCVTEYCRAFSTVSFETLERQFKLDRVTLITLLEGLISGADPGADLSSARLDLEDGYVINAILDERAATEKKVDDICNQIEGAVLDRVTNLSGFMAGLQSRDPIAPTKPLMRSKASRGTSYSMTPMSSMQLERDAMRS